MEKNKHQERYVLRLKNGLKFGLSEQVTTNPGSGKTKWRACKEGEKLTIFGVQATILELHDDYVVIDKKIAANDYVSCDPLV